MAPDSTGRKEIFKDIVFYDASSALSELHRNALLSGGAVEYSNDDGDGVEWSKITHVFTFDMDFPGKQEAENQERLAIMTVCTSIESELIVFSRGGLKSLPKELFYKSTIVPRI